MQKQKQVKHMSAKISFFASELRQLIVKEVFALSALGAYHKDVVYLALQYIDQYWKIQFHSDSQQTWNDPHVRAASLCCLNLALKMCHEINPHHIHPFQQKNKMIGSCEESQTTRCSILDLEFHVLNILQWNLYVSPQNNLLQWYNRFYFCLPQTQRIQLSEEKQDLCFQTYLYWCDVLWSAGITVESIPTTALIAFVFAYIQNEQLLIDRYGLEIQLDEFNAGMSCLRAIQQMNIVLPTKLNQWSKRMDDGEQEWVCDSLKQRKYNWIYKEIPDIGNVFVPILTHEDTIT